MICVQTFPWMQEKIIGCLDNESQNMHANEPNHEHRQVEVGIQNISSTINCQTKVLQQGKRIKDQMAVE